jgi:5-methylcytosine-specific restriction endonuclease McrA
VRNPVVHLRKPRGRRSPLWRHVRRDHLAIEPSCQACGTVDDLEVHHIAPFHLHPELELDPANLITLCEKAGHDCHFVFGHFHDWHRFNPNVRQDVARYDTERRAA